MRATGDESLCDKCGKKISSEEVINAKFFVLSKDDKKKRTGECGQISKLSLCESCYKLLLSFIVKERGV